MRRPETSDDASWLVLIYQLPAKPAYLRVKLWRKLQALGAVPLKNAVHALPMRAQTASAFQDLLAEIEEGGGEGLICQARMIGGLSDADVRAQFDAARDADYEELTREARALLVSDEPGGAELQRLFRKRDEIEAIDFFGAHGRETLEGIFRDIEEKIKAHPPVGRSEDPPQIDMADLKNCLWVTRRDVHVDRIASAWLIRRFIDSGARFKFVHGKNYEPDPGELRFDMAEAEFTHEGDNCTFETLVAYAKLDSDPALRAIAEIVHNLDLKDEKFSRAETAGIRALIAGTCAVATDDEDRIARGSAAFDDLYASFSKRRGA